MSAWIVVTLALLGAGPKMTSVERGAIRLSVPADWTQSEEDGSLKLVAPKGDAMLLLDVGKVQTKGMAAKTCVEKIKSAIGGKWSDTTAGGQPAATNTAEDVAEGQDAALVSQTHVGCNGATTWSIVFSVEKAKAKQYAPDFEAIMKSLKFAAQKR